MERAYQLLRNEQSRARFDRATTVAGLEQERRRDQGFLLQRPGRAPGRILQFPEGKGEAKWHRANDKLFLGIDHTAIVVSDTATS